MSWWGSHEVKYFFIPGLDVCRHIHLFHVTPGSFMEFDVDVVWMWMFVGVLTLTCRLHMRLLHCVCFSCVMVVGGGWVGGGGGC